MSSEVLRVEQRPTRGKRQARKIRTAGKIPAVLYGHQQQTINLAIQAEDLEAAVRHRAHLVELQGAVRESALLKDIQWDAFGVQILHVDLARVSADELVTVDLEINLRGEAPGVHHGGTVEQHVRSIEIQCPANAIPEALSCNINDLDVHGTITAGQLPLPAKARLMVPEDTLIVACVVAAEPEEELAVAGGPAEPEVIGRKPEEGESED